MNDTVNTFTEQRAAPVRNLYVITAYVHITSSLGLETIEQRTFYVPAKSIPQAHSRAVKQLGDALIQIEAINLVASNTVSPETNNPIKTYLV